MSATALATLSYSNPYAQAQRHLVFIKSQIGRNFRLTLQFVDYEFRLIYLIFFFSFFEFAIFLKLILFRIY